MNIRVDRYAIDELLVQCPCHNSKVSHMIGLHLNVVLDMITICFTSRCGRDIER